MLPVLPAIAMGEAGEWICTHWADGQVAQLQQLDPGTGRRTHALENRSQFLRAPSRMTSSHEDVADLALETVRVWTSSGAVYDLRGPWLMRLVPAERTTTVGYDLAHLRRDGEPIAVVEADPPVVGQRWRLLLRVREDGVLTVRETTPVVRVMDLASGRR